jgi:hypothetical protein
MSDRTRAEINRENSQHSTGPRTEEGKAIASSNSRTHGVYARPTLYDTERMKELFHHYLSQMGCENPDQRYWVKVIAECDYKLAGLERVIQGLFLKYYKDNPNRATNPHSDEAFIEDYETSEAVNDKRERYEKIAARLLRIRDQASKRFYQIRRELNNPKYARRHPSAEPDGRPYGRVVPPPPPFEDICENEANLPPL